MTSSPVALRIAAPRLAELLSAKVSISSMIAARHSIPWRSMSRLASSVAYE